jgi:hypothetical protein
MREVNGGAQGSIWVKMIQDANLDAGHFSDVCYEYATASKKLPDPLDDIIADIIKECRERKHKELAKFEQHQKYHQPKAGELMAKVTSMGLAGKICVPLAKSVKAGVITSEENLKRLDEVFAYEKGEIEKPEWLNDYGF